MKNDNSLDLYHEISKTIEDNINFEQEQNNIYNIINFSEFINTGNKHKLSPDSISQVESTCKLILENYYKFIQIAETDKISNPKKIDLISKFIIISFKNIIKSIETINKDYDDKTRGLYSPGTLLKYDLDRDFRNTIERIIELLLIIRKLYAFTDISAHLQNESQKIFDFGKSLGLQIHSRDQNLKRYLSINKENLDNIEIKDSVICYLCNDSTFDLISINKFNLETAEKELNRSLSWKLFRKRRKKEEDVKNARLNLEKEIENLNLKKSNAKKILEKEIETMEEEILKLKEFDKYKFRILDDKDSLITEIRNTVETKIREKLNLQIKEIDGSYDLFNITQLRKSYIEILNSYKATLLENHISLKLTENQIEILFNEISNDLQNEYFE